MRFTRLVSIAIFSLAVTSCGSLSDSDDSDNVGSPSPTPAPKPGPAPAPAPGYGSIPYNAERVMDGYGRQTFRAPSDGKVWVGNENRHYQIVMRRVRRNDKVEVIPERDLVELNDAPIYSQNMEKNDRHAVYFVPSSGGDWGPDPYANIPRDAENVASSTGRFSWRVDSSGVVYIGNDKLKTNIVSTRVKQGDLIEIDPGDDQIKVNGGVIYNQNLESKHRHSIFFREGKGDGGGVIVPDGKPRV